MSDPKKAAGIILDATGLADDAFRLGNTKAWTHTHFPNCCIFDFVHLRRTLTSASILCRSLYIGSISALLVFAFANGFTLLIVSIVIWP